MIFYRSIRKKSSLCIWNNILNDIPISIHTNFWDNFIRAIAKRDSPKSSHDEGVDDLVLRQ